ncbi:hypothetical protein, partial [Methylogaea oryzae]
MFSSNEGRRNPPAQGVGATAAPIDGKPLVDALWQRFSVDFDYPVVFTRNAFSPSNPALADMLSRKENGRRHRVAAVIDEGVA